jgi:protein SCO1/2
MRSRWNPVLLLLAAWALPLGGGAARAENRLPASLEGVGFDQLLGAQVPPDAVFRDEHGKTVRLREYFDGKPVVLVMAYFRCPMLCTEVLNALVRAMLDMRLELGKDFRVLTVSFDAREDPVMAAAKKATYLERYGRGRGEEGWHFLTGEQSSIDRLTRAVGFRYRYDARNDQFAHASGILVLTPGGKISRCFHDVRYSARDLTLGLVEASGGRIGTVTDQVLLYCFHYDPVEGRYGPVVMRFVRLGGVLTLAAILGMVVVLRRLDRRARETVRT